MSEFTLPEGMTAELRRLAEAAIDSKLGHWSGDVEVTVESFYRPVLALLDAIDPPEPESVVTDEMVEVVAVEIRPEDIGRDAWLTLGILKEILKAVERLGWLRTESETLVDWERMFGFLQEDLDTASDENRRLAAENNDLRKRVHDLKSATDNPSSSAEPWPTDEQVEAAALAMFDHASPKMTWSESIHQEVWRERSAAALEAVAPPLNDDAYGRGLADGFAEGRKVRLAEHGARLEMAEGLLRKASPWNVAMRGDIGTWWATHCDVTPAEDEYLRSLDGEGDHA